MPLIMEMKDTSSKARSGEMNLKEIEDYLKEGETDSKLILESQSFLMSVKAIHEEMSPLESKVQSLNDRLKGFDLLDFLSSKEISTTDLKIVNKILQDLKLVEEEVSEREEYRAKYKEIYSRVVEVGNRVVEEKIEKEIESFYKNEDLVTYVVLLENKEEVMKKVVEKRRRVCSLKIGHLQGEKGVFYFLLVNQEIFLWSLLFPGDLNVILRRVYSLDTPLGYSKIERFIYAIFKVYFKGQEEGELRKEMESVSGELEGREVLGDFLGEDGRLREIDNYPSHSSIHNWFYKAFLYKSLREYLNKGVVDL